MEEKTAPERVRSGAAFSAEEGGGESRRFFFTSDGKRAKYPRLVSKPGPSAATAAFVRGGLTAVL